MSNKEYVAFIATNAAIKESISKSILEVYAKEAITEKIDPPHGEKLGHAILSKFFKDVAPKLNSLQDVESALNKLYKDNNIEFTDKVISQVIKSYKDKPTGRSRGGCFPAGWRGWPAAVPTSPRCLGAGLQRYADVPDRHPTHRRCPAVRGLPGGDRRRPLHTVAADT